MRYKMLVLDVDDLSRCLGISVENVFGAFTDGRVIARFAEFWAGRLYGLEVASYNQASYDATRTDDLKDDKISVRVLGKGNIKFQQSKYIGSGRTCTVEDLVSSLKVIDVYVIVDVIGFPEVKILPVKARRLLNFVEKEELTCSGWSRKRFYQKLQLETIDWEVVGVAVEE